MNNITESFQVRLGVTQSDILVLKRSIDEISMQIANQHLQHYKYISETLQKRISDHVHIFQTSIKSHMNHVQQRQKRVMKYGQNQVINIKGPLSPVPNQPNNSNSVSKNHGGSTNIPMDTGGYAMFTKTSNAARDNNQSRNSSSSSSSSFPSTTKNSNSNSNLIASNNNSSSDLSSSSQLRRRTSNQPPSGFGGTVQQVSTLQPASVRNDSMFRNSQKIEKSIAQMGIN